MNNDMEKTPYSELINYLNDLEFEFVALEKLSKERECLLLQFRGELFAISIIFKASKLSLSVIAQAAQCSYSSQIHNIIILYYPKNYAKLTLDTEINALLLTDRWCERLTIPPRLLFKELRNKILNSERNIDFNTIVELIGEFVKSLNTRIESASDEALINEVVDKLDLFSSLSEMKNLERAKRQVINLASYLLFNQILFYHIFERKSNKNRVPELNTVKSIAELQAYFEQLTKIDYRSIYRVNIIKHIKESRELVSELNAIITAVKMLRVEHITQDLAGRFFHTLIPYEVRKVLAAFYTHPAAAELLAALTIDSSDKTVMDPACGSGTLLVAAYRRKKQLAKRAQDRKNISLIHKRFIEQELTGIDLMPFAAHLTAINLTMQDIEQPTRMVRTATMDALELVNTLNGQKFKKQGIKIAPYTTTTQLTLTEEYHNKNRLKQKGAVSPEGSGTAFMLKPVDIVIMNPPFTDRNKMPSTMRENLKKNPLGKICGHQVNLWGYFLALADLLLKDGGIIGAVIPINIARGRATEKIRMHILKNYHIKYIVKPVADVAFSENAEFRDILLVAEKRKSMKDTTKILLLKKSIKLLKQEDIDAILKMDREYVELKEISATELDNYANNLMPLLVPESFFTLYSTLLRSKKLKSFDASNMSIGLPYRPKGVADGVFITNPTHPSRIKSAKVIACKEKNKKILNVKLKSNAKGEFRYTLRFKNVKNALRTNTGVNRLYIESSDYILAAEDEKYITALSEAGVSVPEPFPWAKHISSNIIKKGTHLVIPRKIRLDSPNMHVVAIYSKPALFGVGPSLWHINADEQTAKLMCIYFNSILTILQIMMFKSETLGAGYFELMKSDWSSFKVIDIENIDDRERDLLLELFDRLRQVEFPPIVEQLKDRFWARVELDSTVLKVLGFSDDEIKAFIPQLYDAIVSELK